MLFSCVSGGKISIVFLDFCRELAVIWNNFSFRLALLCFSRFILFLVFLRFMVFAFFVFPAEVRPWIPYSFSRCSPGHACLSAVVIVVVVSSAPSCDEGATLPTRGSV